MSTAEQIKAAADAAGITGDALIAFTLGYMTSSAVADREKQESKAEDEDRGETLLVFGEALPVRAPRGLPAAAVPAATLPAAAVPGLHGCDGRVALWRAAEWPVSKQLAMLRDPPTPPRP